MEQSKGLKFSKPYIKRTIWIGLAFFGILLVWQLYNSYCSPMLSFMFAKDQFAEKYTLAKAFWDTLGPDKPKFDINFLLKLYATNPELGISSADYLSIQWKVGIIMALDNIAALFIMPIFGNLSDKTRTKLGKRMPYIIVGSIVTAIALPFIPFFFNEGMKDGVAIMGMVAGLIATMCVIIVFMMSYRSPAVALMPDLTPKPLRSKANGVINVVGYVGGAIGSVVAMIFALTSHLSGSTSDLWTLEIPFILTSVVLLISLVLLLINVKENELHAKLDAEISAADSLGESAEAVTESNTKLSKKNIINLVIILIAEMLWFMSLNALETFQTNYAIFHLNTSSAGGIAMTLISGAASVIGFLAAGPIADKIGRKWTIFSGICIVTVCYAIYSFIPSQIPEGGTITFEGTLPFIFFIILPVIGLGSSLIHMCSFPLVTDYCTADKLGKFTSLYYTASMLAQSITPIIGGLIMNKTGAWQALPIYSTVLMAAAGIVFVFVKAPHKKDKAKNAKGLEALGSDD